MQTHLVSWDDDFFNESDPLLLRMTAVQIATAKAMFERGAPQEDMSELDSYLSTMPVVENGWICSDTFDGAHVFNPYNEEL